MLSRRRFLVTTSLSAAAGLAVPLSGAQTVRPTRQTTTADLADWNGVRRQFDLDPAWVHAALFFIASHPRPVREAIEKYRRAIDANPYETVEHLMFGPEADNMPLKAASSIASYIGGRPGEIALTQNTTTGLALIYHGLPLKAGDEILTTEHDHYSHHESIRLATERVGATWRRISLFDLHDAISEDEIVDRIRRAIRPNTRVVGVTWVHSSSGLKLPIGRIAEAIAELNRDRADRVLLIVDGVHGMGVEDPAIASSGADAFSAGTHKWIFGPRGTGFVWAKPDVWAMLRPTIPSFISFAVYEGWAQGKPPAGPANGSWFAPGGFQAYEHHWALPVAFDFHRAIGPTRVTKRIHELNSRLKEGLAAMSHVTLYTPRSSALSAGIVCFDVKGMKPQEVVSALHKKRILASTTPYRVTYARLSFGVANTPEEVEKTLREVNALRTA